MAYAETGNINHAAREAQCTWTSAKKYVTEHADELQKLREQKKADVLNQMAVTRIRALEELITPHRLVSSSTGELTTLVGVLTDKIQILSGGVTSRSAHLDESDPASRLTPEELEQAAKIRERLAAEVA